MTKKPVKRRKNRKGYLTTVFVYGIKIKRLLNALKRYIAAKQEGHFLTMPKGKGYA